MSGGASSVSFSIPGARERERGGVRDREREKGG